jgi:two-component system LytT family response regulator
MSTRMRILIADDEDAARAKLRRLLAAHADVEIVGEAATGIETVTAVRGLRPDLVLLDVRMPSLDGFAALDALAGDDSPRPKVVFVTAFDEYAVRAFDVRAFDYLLKPYDARRLASALARVRSQLELEHRPSIEALRSLLEARVVDSDAQLESAETTRYLERVCIRSSGRTQIVRLADVEWIEACGNYVRLHTATERPLARETLKHLDESLDPTQFCRIHRGAIVNMSRIREMKPSVSGDYVIRLESGMRLRLSRSYRAELDRRIRR